jgi:hypothetical protein
MTAVLMYLALVFLAQAAPGSLSELLGNPELDRRGGETCDDDRGHTAQAANMDAD